MTLLRLYWSQIACMALTAAIAWVACGQIIAAKERKHEIALGDMREAERAACAEQQAKTKEANDAYIRKNMAGYGRAQQLTSRVLATCGNLSLPGKTVSGDRADGHFCMDRSHLAELIELARRCESNTNAAITLDGAWPK